MESNFSVASEEIGLPWKAWKGDFFEPQGTAYDGQLYEGRLTMKASQTLILVAEQVRPGIEAWRRIRPDPSPDALMFPTFGWGKRKGQAVPLWGKNFLHRRIRPVARHLGISDHLITYQVMRGTLGTDLQKHVTVKDAQSALRHASIRTTPDVYMQPVEESVVEAVNSRTRQILSGGQRPVLDDTNAIVPRARRLMGTRAPSDVESHLSQVRKERR